MAARSRSFAPPAAPPVTIGAVTPAWLASRAKDPTVRILDVRVDASSPDESGHRLRIAETVDLRPLAHLGGPAGWRASPVRHPSRSGPPAVYLRGHIPGAVAFDVRARLFDDEGELVSAPELAMAMSSLGVGDGHAIVLVDDGRPSAALAAAWALARYGRSDVQVLEGGFARWLGEGRAVSSEIARHPPASFTARVIAAAH